MSDVTEDLDRTTRLVTRHELPDGPGHAVVLRRVLATPVEDAWDACTDPARLARWFLPVTGDLQLGGRYQLDDNAGGEITECDPPRRLAVTWVYGEDPGPGLRSVVTLDLVPGDGDITELTLSHSAADDDHWTQYGPGAAGVGWDLTLLGLTRHLAGSTIEAGWEETPAAIPFLLGCAERWGSAHEASGTPASEARAAATRTADFYAPQASQPGSRTPAP